MTHCDDFMKDYKLEGNKVRVSEHPVIDCSWNRIIKKLAMMTSFAVVPLTAAIFVRERWRDWRRGGRQVVVKRFLDPD